MKKLFTALLLAFGISSAFADTTSYCSNFAQFANNVTIARNAGMKQSFLQEQVFANIDNGKTTKFQAIDKIELGRIITIIYNNPQVTPEYAGTSYFQHCMAENTDS